MNINNPGNAIYGTLKDMPVYLYRGTKKLATPTGTKILEVYEKVPTIKVDNQIAVYTDAEEVYDIYNWSPYLNRYAIAEEGAVNLEHSICTKPISNIIEGVADMKFDAYIISKNGGYFSNPDHDTMYIMAPEGRIIPEQYTAFVMVYVTGKSISRSMLGYLYLIEKEDIPEMLPISNHNANVIYATCGNNENELEIFSWDEETSAYKGIGYLEVNNNG